MKKNKVIQFHLKWREYISGETYLQQRDLTQTLRSQFIQLKKELEPCDVVLFRPIVARRWKRVLQGQLMEMKEDDVMTNKRKQLTELQWSRDKAVLETERRLHENRRVSKNNEEGRDVFDDDDEDIRVDLDELFSAISIDDTFFDRRELTVRISGQVDNIRDSHLGQQLMRLFDAVIDELGEMPLASSALLSSTSTQASSSSAQSPSSPSPASPSPTKRKKKKHQKQKEEDLVPVYLREVVSNRFITRDIWHIGMSRWMFSTCKLFTRFGLVCFSPEYILFKPISTSSSHTKLRLINNTQSQRRNR